jgi:hypothetical protein
VQRLRRRSIVASVNSSRSPATATTVHIASFSWKADADLERVEALLRDVEALAERLPGIIEISCRVNTSKYVGGYSHVVLVRGESKAAVDGYLADAEHRAAADVLHALCNDLIAVDRVTSAS